MNKPRPCPHGCERVLSEIFKGKADGSIPPRSKEASYRPQLDDDYCRYCSRAISAEAVAIEKELARPASHDVFAQASSVSVSHRRKPYQRKPVRA